MSEAAQTISVKRTYKFRLITPNTPAGAAQRATFAQLAGSSRVVWNAGVAHLADRRKNPEKYEDTKLDLRSAFSELREEKPWFAPLIDGNETRPGCFSILDYSLRRLRQSRQRAFDRLKEIKAIRAAGNKTRKKAGFPKFHAKREDESFTVSRWSGSSPSPVRISESRKRILLPGILNRLEKGKRTMPKGDDRHPGWIRLNRKIPEAAAVKCAVIKRDGRKWFAFLQCEVEIPVPPPHSGPAIGLDMNAESRARVAGSDGNMFPAALGENELRDLEQSEARVEKRLKRHERRMSRCRDIALRERAGWNRENTARKRAEKRLKDSHMEEIASRAKHRVVVAGPYCVLPQTLAEACENAGLPADKMESCGVLRLLADRKSPTRKFFAENVAGVAPGVSLPQWRRAKMELDKLLPRNRRRYKFGESKFGVRYQIHRTRKRRAAAKGKNIRENFTHRVSAKLTRKFGLIGAEALDLVAITASAKGTEENPGKNVRAKTAVNREMRNKSFGGLRTKLKYKAQARGGQFLQTPYAYTSQACNNCAAADPDSRKDSRFKCVHCGHRDDAQTNAAKNVLAVTLKMAANPEAAEDIPKGPSKKTKEFVIAAIREYGRGPAQDRKKESAIGEAARPETDTAQAAHPKTGARGVPSIGRAPARSRASGPRASGEGENGVLRRMPARSRSPKTQSSKKSANGNMREITPAKARNRATKAQKESGLFPDSSAKSIRCAGKGGTTP